jgi:hypothetical protein
MATPLVFTDFEFAGFPPDRQFHVLKHLFAVDNKYREYLMSACHCTEKDIEDQIKQNSSKFLESFSNNPEDLLDMLKDEFNRQNIEAYWSDGRCEFQIDFSRTEYPGGIGEDRIIHLGDVPDVIKKPFTGKDLKTLQSIIYRSDPKMTWTANVILELSDGQPVIIALFPGIFAPAFPNREEQTEERYLASMKFWSEHIIIS